jgi:hypothetical protein
MKRMILCAGIFLLISVNALSQTKSKKESTVQQPKNHVSKNKENGSVSNALILNSSGSYDAKGTASGLSTWKNNYVISDPLLTTLSARANGANIQYNHSGIVGMPKRAYGFSNGHIILNPSGAVTSGTQTGSGAVGTGTSLATFGSIGAPMHVNGKSSNAGINTWGNAMNLPVTQKDSLGRLAPVKQK